jgi:hypothetical protein
MADEQVRPGTPAWQQQLEDERRGATAIKIVSLDSAVREISFGAVFLLVFKVLLALAILATLSWALVAVVVWGF